MLNNPDHIESKYQLTLRYKERMKMGYNIAIDGPASSGKSTVAKRLAKELGYIYVDTGAMYRALALYFKRKGLSGDEKDKEKVIKVCPDATVRIDYEEGTQQIFLNEENVTTKIREEDIGKLASETSIIPQVRAHLLALQRDLAKNNDVVMDGRDIGTCILPNADLKIFLVATEDVRAKRRYLEYQQRGIESCLEDIKKDIIERDYRDSNREVAPLKQAEDAILVDSSWLSIDEVVKEILKHLIRKP
jgi:cytidylate kinase